MLVRRLFLLLGLLAASAASEASTASRQKRYVVFPNNARNGVRLLKVHSDF